MRNSLEITVARHAGFCMGVRRALDICLEAANDPSLPRPISTLGPLIHNRQVLDVLERKGIKEVEEGAADGDIGTAVVRAHGISPDKRKGIRRVSGRIIDATCPHVRNVQNIVKKYSGLGYRCIIVGDPGHAEVEGVMSCAGEAGVVVRGPEDVPGPGVIEKAVVVAQTTQKESVFREVAARVRAGCAECLVFDTICRATRDRQNEAIELARAVEAMVVVGGYNSANTRRLAQICAETATPVFHVETEAELPLEDVLRFRKIGVTAGASTPNWMIKRVVSRLYRAEESRNRPLSFFLRRLLAVPVRTNAFLGGGAACMTYVAFALLGLPAGNAAVHMGLAFCFIMSQHLLHQYTKRKAMLLNEPERAEFFERRSGLLLMLAAVTASVSLALAFRIGMAPFLLILLGTAGGVLYCIPEQTGRALRSVDRLRRLTGSKEFFVALAWTAVTVLVPYLSAPYPPGAAAIASVALFTALMAFHRTLVTDMRDFEGDQLVGRETVVVAFGRKAAACILVTVPPVLVLLLLAATAVGWISTAGYAMLLTPCYCLLVSFMYLKDRLPDGETGEAMVDSGFYLAGLLALLGSGAAAG